MNPVLSAAAVAARYKGVQMTTASPIQLVVMLYDGLLRFTNEADDALGKNDRARAGDRIGRGLAILDELTATLDGSHAPELCENLTALYGFCKRRLFSANLESNREHLKDVVATLTPLREAWGQLAAQK